MGTKGGLNNEDLGLELEINGDLRLSNRGLMKKSCSLGGCCNTLGFTLYSLLLKHGMSIILMYCKCV